MNGHESVLINFNMLMNMDYPIIKVMIDKYNNKKIIRDLSSLSMDEICELLSNRVEWNPLHIMVRSEYEDQCDSILLQLIENEMDYIMENLIVNPTIYSFAEGARNSSVVDCTICCKNVHQQQLIKDLFAFKTVLYEEVSYEKYDAFMIHYKQDIMTDYKRYIDKTIYLAETKYNLVIDKNGNYNIDNMLAVIMSEHVNIKLIPIFNKKEIKEELQ